MKGTHLLLIVNTSTWWKTELHLTNLAPYTVCYIQNFIVWTAGLVFQGYHILVPSIKLIFLQMVSVPLRSYHDIICCNCICCCDRY